MAQLAAAHAGYIEEDTQGHQAFHPHGASQRMGADGRGEVDPHWGPQETVIDPSTYEEQADHRHDYQAESMEQDVRYEDVSTVAPQERAAANAAKRKQSNVGFYGAIAIFVAVAGAILAYKMGVFAKGSPAPGGLTLAAADQSLQSRLPQSPQLPSLAPPAREAAPIDSGLALTQSVGSGSGFASGFAATSDTPATPASPAFGAPPAQVAAPAFAAPATQQTLTAVAAGAVAAPPAAAATPPAAALASKQAKGVKAAAGAQKPAVAVAAEQKTTLAQNTSVTPAAPAAAAAPRVRHRARHAAQARAKRAPAAPAFEPVLTETTAELALERDVTAAVGTGTRVSPVPVPTRITLRGTYPRAGDATRAWLAMEDGRVLTVVVGDRLPNGAVIEAIDAAAMSVRTNAGVIRP